MIDFVSPYTQRQRREFPFERPWLWRFKEYTGKVKHALQKCLTVHLSIALSKTIDFGIYWLLGISDFSLQWLFVLGGRDAGTGNGGKSQTLQPTTNTFFLFYSLPFSNNAKLWQIHVEKRPCLNADYSIFLGPLYFKLFFLHYKSIFSALFDVVCFIFNVSTFSLS